MLDSHFPRAGFHYTQVYTSVGWIRMVFLPGVGLTRRHMVWLTHLGLDSIIQSAKLEYNTITGTGHSVHIRKSSTLNSHKQPKSVTHRAQHRGCRSRLDADTTVWLTLRRARATTEGTLLVLVLYSCVGWARSRFQTWIFAKVTHMLCLCRT